MEQKELVETLLTKDVNKYTEEKNGLTYLSWANAWQEFLKICPDATFDVKMFKDENGLDVPYCGNSGFGYMVFTSITACGTTRSCFLPVMDNRNKAILQPNMFEINKTLMRCIAKNISLFGLGLYVYTGEDIPTDIDKPITEEQIKTFENLGVKVENVLMKYRKTDISQLTEKEAETVIAIKQRSLQQ